WSPPLRDPHTGAARARDVPIPRNGWTWPWGGDRNDGWHRPRPDVADTPSRPDRPGRGTAATTARPATGRMRTTGRCPPRSPPPRDTGRNVAAVRPRNADAPDAPREATRRVRPGCVGHAPRPEPWPVPDDPRWRNVRCWWRPPPPRP